MSMRYLQCRRSQRLQTGSRFIEFASYIDRSVYCGIHYDMLSFDSEMVLLFMSVFCFVFLLLKERLHGKRADMKVWKDE